MPSQALPLTYYGLPDSQWHCWLMTFYWWWACVVICIPVILPCIIIRGDGMTCLLTVLLPSHSHTLPHIIEWWWPFPSEVIMKAWYLFESDDNDHLKWSGSPITWHISSSLFQLVSQMIQCWLYGDVWNALLILTSTLPLFIVVSQQRTFLPTPGHYSPSKYSLDPFPVPTTTTNSMPLFSVLFDGKYPKWWEWSIIVTYPHATGFGRPYLTHHGLETLWGRVPLLAAVVCLPSRVPYGCSLIPATHTLTMQVLPDLCLIPQPLLVMGMIDGSRAMPVPCDRLRATHPFAPPALPNTCLFPTDAYLPRALYLSSLPLFVRACLPLREVDSHGYLCRTSSLLPITRWPCLPAFHLPHVPHTRLQVMQNEEDGALPTTRGIPICWCGNRFCAERACWLGYVCCCWWREFCAAILHIQTTILLLFFWALVGIPCHLPRPLLPFTFCRFPTLLEGGFHPLPTLPACPDSAHVMPPKFGWHSVVDDMFLIQSDHTISCVGDDVCICTEGLWHTYYPTLQKEPCPIQLGIAEPSAGARSTLPVFPMFVCDSHQADMLCVCCRGIASDGGNCHFPTLPH